MPSSDPLELFLPPVRQWFRTALGTPTAAQRLGWPVIAANRHTLILAPTGSGKTLAAFLACLDTLWRAGPLGPGVRLLYVSPLKALNNDIYRNVQLPLQGVAEAARQMGQPLSDIRIGLRTGDTPPAERRQFLRCPPQVLVTTPESLHLLLTSGAREALRSVTHCIVDEIHALCSNKRGVFLALLLERLEALAAQRFVRIGLSATQRPLEEIARFLGGSEENDGTFEPRPVAIVDAGLRKELDLRVVSPVEHFGPLPEKSIWPAIYHLLDREVRRHRSTIIFTNNRRTVERITAALNEEETSGEPSGVSRRVEQPGGLRRSARPEVLARAHHGSIALEVRQQTEQALKEGRLPAVVATASLELGIDMGAVDLVCQVGPTGNVARGLQRVGRAGHLVGSQSKGRLVPRTLADLVEQAVLAHEMAAGRVEESRIPVNCLDVLAQQVIAMTAMDDCTVPALYARVRCAYPYRDLSPQAFESVLEMISGRFRSGGEQPGQTMSALKPRISWDRVHNRLLALPGSKQLAVVSGGTIPDTGQYAACTVSGVRVGELDEEFVYERRVGDVFLLGTSAWRLESIEVDRVILAPAEGVPAMAPFWHGEQAGRSLDLGLAIGKFLRELTERLNAPGCRTWLEEEWFLEPRAALDLWNYVRRQLAAGPLPTDRTLVVEASRDPLGDWQVILLSPLGSRLHLTLRLALEARLRQRLGYTPQCLHHDDGILVRLADSEVPIMDLLDGLTPENVEELILGELGESALFALRFRQNAARALLLPRLQPGKRAPLWLQRLRGRDLLKVARQYPDFPLVAETFRECLHDHLDLPALQALLEEIRAGRATVVTRRAESPSPFAAGLLFAFTAAFMYQDDSGAGDARTTPALDRQLLEQLISPERHRHLLDPRAVFQVERRLRGLGLLPRNSTEMAEWLRRLGDLSPGELEGPMAGFLEELTADGRAMWIELPRCRQPERWISTEEEVLYRRAFGMPAASPVERALTTGLNEANGEVTAQAAAETILRRFLETHALVGLADVVERYPFEAGWARRQLEDWSRAGQVVAVQEDGESVRWSAPCNLEQVQRSTLALLRREVTSCAPPQFADFVLRWQGVHPQAHPAGAEGWRSILDRLQGLPLPAELWEQWIFPSRVPEYQPTWLDEWIAGGEGTWACEGETERGSCLLAVLHREDLASFPPPYDDVPEGNLARVRDCLQIRGAAFVTDLARETKLPPGEVRSCLWTLLRRRLATNDSFDVIRRGQEDRLQGATSDIQANRRSLSARRRGVRQRPEGRWSLLPWGQPDAEAQAVFQARLLLRRYGIVARELAAFDSWMLPWRVLYEVLSRMELAGEVRRGYFVEGLSGAQFALPEAAQMLQESALPSTALAPVLLVHTLDPANLYGSGAPFDIPLLDGGKQPLLRRAGNWLVLRAGRPVLIVEQQGKRLTALASASQEDLAQAIGCLPQIQARNAGLQTRHKLTVEEWNGQPVTSTPARELLEAAGFVRDYQAMTLYAAWR